LRLSKKKIDQLIGFVVGIGAPVFAIAVALESYPVLKDLGDIANPAWRIIVMRAITFGIIINAAIFFAAINWGRDQVGKGILFSCIPSLLAVVYFQLIV